MLNRLIIRVEKSASLTHLHHEVEVALIRVGLEVLDDVWVVDCLHHAYFVAE